MTQLDTDPQRVSFSVDILFSEPLHFDLAEIVAAVNEDFPSCQIKDTGLSPSTSCRTDKPVLAVLAPAEKHDGGVIKLIGAGCPDEAFRDANHTEAYWRSGGFGQDAVLQHQSYLNFSVEATDETLAARFRAARLLNVVTAVFAKLPITLAINVSWSGHFVRPDHWVTAAEEAVKGNWPMLAWLSYRGAWDGGPGRPSDHAIGYTAGLKQFLPYELYLEAAPIKPDQAIRMLIATAWLPLQGGNVFEDGNTVGVEEDTRYRLRRRHAPDGTPQDIFVLLHPDSPLDEVAEFGDCPGIPTPMEEPYIRRPRKGFMQSLLGRN